MPHEFSEMDDADLKSKLEQERLLRSKECSDSSHENPVHPSQKTEGLSSLEIQDETIELILKKLEIIKSISQDQHQKCISAANREVDQAYIEVFRRAGLFI